MVNDDQFNNFIMPDDATNDLCDALCLKLNSEMSEIESQRSVVGSDYGCGKKIYLNDILDFKKPEFSNSKNIDREE